MPILVAVAGANILTKAPVQSERNAIFGHGKVVVYYFTKSSMEFDNVKSIPSSEKAQALPGVVCLKMREARSTGWLSLNGIRLHNVPRDVCKKLRHLHHLYMSGCKLFALVPAELQVLSKLVILDLSNNGFTEVPRCLFLNLRNLKTLDLSDNKLSGIPYTVDQLVSLEELCLADNQIVVLPSNLGQLPRLKTLDVSCNLLREIPASLLMGKIKHSLVCLRLRGNLLQKLPREIGGLRNLEELDIQDNNMSYLPVTAKSLLRLQVFQHKGNNWVKGTDVARGKTEGSYGTDALSKIYSFIYSLP